MDKVAHLGFNVLRLRAEAPICPLNERRLSLLYVFAKALDYS